MGRITLGMDLRESIIKMADGNPGALTVLMQLLEKVSELDPKCLMGGLWYVLRLDDLGIYGSNIWVLYKDVCNGEIENLVSLIRANQLDLCGMSSHMIESLISNPVRDLLNFEEIKKSVNDELSKDSE